MSRLSREALIAGFNGEVQAYLPVIREDLHALMIDPGDRGRLRQVFRLFHNIKGAASQLDLRRLSGTARLAEDMLEAILVEGRPSRPEELLFLSTTVELISDHCASGALGDDLAADELLIAAIRAYHLVVDPDEGLDDGQIRDEFQTLCDGDSIAATVSRVGIGELMDEAFATVQRIGRELAGTLPDQAILADSLRLLKRLVLAAETQAEEYGEEVPPSYTEAFVSFLDWLVDHICLLGPHGADLLNDYLSYFRILLRNSDRIEAEKTRRVVDSMNQVREITARMAPAPAKEDFSEIFEEPDFIATDEEQDIFGDPFDGTELFDDELAETFRLPDESDSVEPAAVQAKVAIEDDDEVDLADIFRAESEEHLAVISSALAAVSRLVDAPREITGSLAGHLGDMRRAVHTLKGAAGMTGQDRLHGFAFGCEDLLDVFVEDGRTIVPDDVALLTAVTGVMKRLTAAPEQVDDAELETLATAMENRMEGSDQAVPPSQADQLEESVADEVDAAFDELFAEPDFLLGVEDEPATQFDEIGYADDSSDTGQDGLVAGKPADSAGAEGGWQSSVADDDAELADIFRAESEEHLEVIGNALIGIEGLVSVPRDISGPVAEHLSGMRRAVHTLKGAAGMTGQERLAGFAHRCEDLLDTFFETGQHIGPRDVSVLAEAVDLMESMAMRPEGVDDAVVERLSQAIGACLDEHRVVLAESAPQENEDELEVHLDELEELPEPLVFDDHEHEGPVQEEDTVPAQAAAQAPDERAVQGSDTAFLRVRMERLDELVGLESELIVARSAMEQRVVALSQTVDELNFAREKLRNISQELDSGFEVESLYGFGQGMKTAAGGGTVISEQFTEFDPIELDRYSQLHLIIRSLNEVSVDVSSIHRGIADLANEMRGHVAQQQLLMRVMQDKLMRVRMTPLSSISRNFFRTVRSAAAQLGRQVRLVIEGEEVYLDRYIWNKVADPIAHLLRNAVDHGIEDASVRTAAGKSAQGTIRMKAIQRGSHVVLEISDDGGGIDLDAIRKKISSMKGPDAVSKMSEAELLDQLFTPGFTTRQQVSRLSGRGVGLDVVRQNLSELRGAVRVQSEAGSGTIFHLRIPISLSINRAAIISIGSERFAVPLQDILEIRKVTARDVVSGETVTVKMGEETIEIRDIASLFRLRDSLPWEETGRTDLSILLVEGEGQNVGLVIDGVLEQQEIIVKDLGTHLLHVFGIGGVTVMGDGSLVPIVNVNELALLAKPVEMAGERKEDSEEAGPFTVMIVDDSVSVRQSVSRLVKANGWAPVLATDGVDASEKIEDSAPDVIILDIEMPRMNGFEFLGIIRSQDRYRTVPIIMLTSRFSEKHQQKANELGADHYVIKPYKEDEFVSLLQRIADETQR